MNLRITKTELLTIGIICALMAALMVYLVAKVPIGLADPKPKLPPMEQNRIHHPNGFSIIAPQGWLAIVETTPQKNRDRIWIQPDTDARWSPKLIATLHNEKTAAYYPHDANGYEPGKYLERDAMIYEGLSHDYHGWHAVFSDQGKRYGVLLMLPHGHGPERYDEVPDHWWPFLNSFRIDKPEKHVLIATWNVRGYPETEEPRREWFSEKLTEISPDILCVQEIANQDRIDTFLANETHFTSAAFLDSNDGQDNAIFAADWVEMDDIPDPNGFQHPVQAAYVAYKGFDAVIVTLHLSYTNRALREQEKLVLVNVVTEALQIDPDVIIAGDFNIQEQEIEQLAQSIGMQVMVPVGQDGIGTTDGNNRYDHFLISPDLASEEAISCEIQTYPGEAIAWVVSDHIPVVAVFSAKSRYKDRE